MMVGNDNERLAQAASDAVETSAAEMNAETNSSSDTENSAKKDGGNKATRFYIMDYVAGQVGKFIQPMVRQADTKRCEEIVHNLFRTVMEFNKNDAAVTYVKVDGIAYRYDEYYTLEQFKDLYVPDRFVATDSYLSRDFKDRKAYVMTKGRVLTPGEFKTQSQELAHKLRINWTPEALKWDEVELLATTAVNSVKGKNCHSTTQKHFSLTTVSFTEDVNVKLDEWARYFVSGLTSK